MLAIKKVLGPWDFTSNITIHSTLTNASSSKKSSITPQNFLITFVFLEIQCPQSPPGLLFFWNIPIFDDIMVVATSGAKKQVCVQETKISQNGLVP